MTEFLPSSNNVGHQESRVTMIPDFLVSLWTFFAQSCGQQTPLPSEADGLSPYMKFVRYRKLPCKSILNGIILAFLLTNVFVYQISLNQDERSMRQMLLVFVPGDGQAGDEPFQHNFINTSDVVTFMQDSTYNYFNLVRSNPGHINFLLDPKNLSQIEHPKMTVWQQQSSVRRVTLHRIDTHSSGSDPDRTNVSVYTLSLAHSPAGPFSSKCKYPWVKSSSGGEQILAGGHCHATHIDGDWFYPCRSGQLGDSCNDIFDEVQKVEVEMRYFVVKDTADSLWVVRQIYDFSTHNGHLTMTMDLSNVQTPKKHNSRTNNTILNSVLLLFVIWDICLRVRSGFKENLIWFSWAMLSHTSSFCFVFFQLYENSGNNEVETFQNIRRFVLALSCFMTMFLCLSYFRNIPRYYVLMKAMAHSLPHLARFLTAVIPIFFGYAFMGIAMFGSYSKYFKNLDRALVTLYCVLNGDSVRDMFLALDQTDELLIRIFSKLYLYTFICLFIYNVLNVTLTIVQDTYIGIKEAYGVFTHQTERLHEEEQQVDTGSPRAQPSVLPDGIDELPGSPRATVTLSKREWLEIVNAIRVLTT